MDAPINPFKPVKIDMYKTELQKRITLEFIKWKKKLEYDYIHGYNGMLGAKREEIGNIIKDDDKLFDYWMKEPKPFI
jgi:hypothetical protein